MEKISETDKKNDEPDKKKRKRENPAKEEPHSAGPSVAFVLFRVVNIFYHGSIHLAFSPVRS